MVEENERFVVDGILSFIKGCRIFLFGGRITSSDPTFVETNALEQSSNNPSVYTKISCFLPWIAEQYNLDIDQHIEDSKCKQGTGNISDITQENGICRGNPTFRNTDQEIDERFCIFPFYFNGEIVNNCIQLGRLIET